jgi:hypothetical protein
MNKQKTMISIFYTAVVLCVAGTASASVKEVTEEMYATGYQQFRLSLHQYFASQRPTPMQIVTDTDIAPKPQKSVAKAALFSAAVPGTGQFYYGSYWKGALFLGVETAAWFSYFNYRDEGSRQERAFENFADEHWYEDDYWNWMSDRSGIPLSDDDGLRAYERAEFSHSLPRNKNQQYYENIGKYNQFNIGWDDTNAGEARDSERRESYTFMRRDANNQFKKASTMLTVILFNHVLSAFEAGFSTKRMNSKIKSAQLRLGGFMYEDKFIPSLNLGLRW